MFLLTQPLLNLVGAAALAVPYPPPPVIDWFTIDSGGGVSTAGELVLEGTIGQFDGGPPSPVPVMTGGPFTLTGGFWTGAGPGPLCPADFNGDGDLNPDDLGDFITCYFLETAIPGACPAAEFNQDGAINADDLGDYITAYFSSCNT